MELGPAQLGAALPARRRRFSQSSLPGEVELRSPAPAGRSKEIAAKNRRRLLQGFKLQPRALPAQAVGQAWGGGSPVAFDPQDAIGRKAQGCRGQLQPAAAQEDTQVRDLSRPGESG